MYAYTHVYIYIYTHRYLFTQFNFFIYLRIFTVMQHKTMFAPSCKPFIAWGLRTISQTIWSSD